MEQKQKPCFVRHEDAGGQCWEPGAGEVYGISFCEAHGVEATFGVLLPERPKGPADIEYRRALVCAYPEAEVPEQVRERVTRWQLDERAGGQEVVDSLLDSLSTLYRLIRIAHRDGETWLVEVLEEERQSIAAQAACALAEHECERAPAEA